jgi:hypothetical protein
VKSTKILWSPPISCIVELNEIKVNENHEIFEVHGQNEYPRRRTLII